MTTNSRATFGSKFGVILASVGSAVGLGNVWRFPYEADQNGGGAFLIVYIGCVLILGIPMLMAEFYVGRSTRSNAVGAFRKMTRNRVFRHLGYIGVLSSLLIMGFYPVVAGWTMEYMWQSLTGAFTGLGPEEFVSDFENFSTSTFRPVMWVVIFMLMTHFIIRGGVQSGIERSSKVMMPLLFVMLLLLCVRSLTLSGAGEGLRFLFCPEFDKIDSNVILCAMGQAFFSLSIGAGTMITYASYFGDDVNLPRTATDVAVLDTLVAVLAGVIIFPAVFTFGIAPTQGPNLVFVTLPNIFAQMPWGNLWAFVFFLLLMLAAITSVISLHQVITAYVEEEFALSHRRATTVVTVVTILLSVLGSLSLGVLNGVRVGGLCLFDGLDFLSAKILMPLGSFFISLFLGWKVDSAKIIAELNCGDTSRVKVGAWFILFLKYVGPVLIGLIFLNELGLFGR